jgi:hypothetical protein
MKTYTTKSNAIRAAKSANVDPATVYATEGGFTFATAAPATESEALVVALVEDPARLVVVGPATEPVPYAFAEGTNSAGQPAGGPVVVNVGPALATIERATESAEAALAAIGKRAAGGRKPRPVKPVKTHRAAKGKAAEAKPAKPGRKPKAEKKPAEPKAPRDTKLSRFVAMLQRPEGCTLDDAMEAFGWQRHTARGAIAGAIKVKLGHKVETEKVEGKTVYRIPA